MKKIFAILLINLIFNNIALAESYYFKNCKLNEIISADYLIDLDNKIINIVLKNPDGEEQKLFDKIKLVEKNRIVTENWLNKHGFKYHSLLMGKPRGGNYHWIDNHLVRATRYNGKFTDLVEKKVKVQVFDDEI